MNYKMKSRIKEHFFGLGVTQNSVLRGCSRLCSGAYVLYAMLNLNPGLLQAEHVLQPIEVSLQYHVPISLGEGCWAHPVKLRGHWLCQVSTRLHSK